MRALTSIIIIFICFIFLACNSIKKPISNQTVEDSLILIITSDLFENNFKHAHDFDTIYIINTLNQNIKLNSYKHEEHFYIFKNQPDFNLKEKLNYSPRFNENLDNQIILLKKDENLYYFVNLGINRTNTFEIIDKSINLISRGSF